jgi:transcriptional regulator with XRE-family HTH domain
MEFRDALRKRREMLSMDAAELARNLSRRGFPTTAADILLWERGRNTPPLDQRNFREALAECLQVRVDTLERIVRPSQLQNDYSDIALQAAHMVDSLPERYRELAVGLLETLTRGLSEHPPALRTRPRDLWQDE